MADVGGVLCGRGGVRVEAAAGGGVRIAGAGVATAQVAKGWLGRRSARRADALDSAAGCGWLMTAEQRKPSFAIS